MNKVLKSFLNILNIFVKITLVVVIVFCGYSYLSKVFYNKEVSHGESFHSLPENSMDAIVLGSSHAQFSFVPHFFYEQTGLYSYVLGTGCQPIEVSYQMLKEALKTQSPKVVFLEVYTALPLRIICEADSSYIIAEYQMTGEEKINTINYLPKEKAKQYYNDFLNYHNDWRYVESFDEIKPKNVLNKKHEIDSTFGYCFQYAPKYYPENWWPSAYYDVNENLDVKLDELDMESLINIKKICDENDIELILYKTPIDSMDIENQSYLHKIWEWADKENIKYIDFIAEGREKEFYMWIHSDSYHAYINGAGLITYDLSKLINDSDIKFNHKENPEITKLLIDTVPEYTYEYLAGEFDPMKYLRILSESHGYILLRYNYAGNEMNDDLYNMLLGLGVEEFDTHKPYFAILKDGEIIESSTNTISSELEGKKITIDSDKISVDDNIYANDGSNLSFVYGTYDLGSLLNKSVDFRWRPWDFNTDIYVR